MQQTNEAVILDSPRLDAADEISVIPGDRAEGLAEVAHDARNMVTALACYCDLLEEPGVLEGRYRHYASELRLVADASRQLVEKLLALRSRTMRSAKPVRIAPPHNRGLSLVEPTPMSTQSIRYRNAPPQRFISNLAWELQVNQNLLAAVAGSRINLTVDSAGGEIPVRMTSEDLTRVLVNLVKNAVQAMPAGGAIQIAVRPLPGQAEDAPWVILSVEDNGPGIATEAMEWIFQPGFTTRTTSTDSYGIYSGEHRGLGLSITRSLVEAAGGRIQVTNRDPSGACFQIELPVRT
jgi:signal transduction histidine kinase